MSFLHCVCQWAASFQTALLPAFQKRMQQSRRIDDSRWRSHQERTMHLLSTWVWLRREREAAHGRRRPRSARFGPFWPLRTILSMESQRVQWGRGSHSRDRTPRRGRVRIQCAPPLNAAVPRGKKTPENQAHPHWGSHQRKGSRISGLPSILQAAFGPKHRECTSRTSKSTACLRTVE